MLSSLWNNDCSSVGSTLNASLVMLWTLAVVLFILWILGFLAFHVGGGLIHILLVVAIIIAIVRLVQGRRPV